MFYTNRVLFIHQVRTGGTWLTDWAASHLGASVDRHFLKHVPLAQIWQAIPRTRDLISFTVRRNIDDVSRSYHRLACDHALGRDCTNEWREVCVAIRSMSYAEYLASSYAPSRLGPYDDIQTLFWYTRPLANVVAWLEQVHA